MQVEILGDGKRADYEVNGTIIRIMDINGAYIEVDCHVMQEDSAVTVDICRDKAGNLIKGTENGVSYVASIIIPPQEKYEQPKLDKDGEPAIDENGNQIYETVVSPIDMNKVRLVLWPLPITMSESNKNKEENKDDNI